MRLPAWRASPTAAASPVGGGRIWCRWMRGTAWPWSAGSGAPPSGWPDLARAPKSGRASRHGLPGPPRLIGAPAPAARLALYWAPEVDDPLHHLGSAWLGRDAEIGTPVPQPRLPGLDLAALTADPRGYGLHATLKPPFHLACSWVEATERAEALAARIAPF